MDNSFLEKKAQIGDTMTWVVATLIIVAVLAISIFASKFVLPEIKPIFLDDKKKDFLATKSITSFLREEKNVNLLKSGNEEKIQSEIGKFLQKASSGEGTNPGGWNLEIEKNNEKVGVNHYRVVGSSFAGIGLIETVKSIAEETDFYSQTEFKSGDYETEFERGSVKIIISGNDLDGTYTKDGKILAKVIYKR